MLDFGRLGYFSFLGLCDFFLCSQEGGGGGGPKISIMEYPNPWITHYTHIPSTLKDYQWFLIFFQCNIDYCLLWGVAAGLAAVAGVEAGVEHHPPADHHHHVKDPDHQEGGGIPVVQDHLPGNTAGDHALIPDHQSGEGHAQGQEIGNIGGG